MHNVEMFLAFRDNEHPLIYMLLKHKLALHAKSPKKWCRSNFHLETESKFHKEIQRNGK